ncbi:hypothetical protein MLD38_039776 [Melastoma candidum]|uniref:Uncharacterized protein n=1 Tax=Melastoma candidum TaxID=119954 RepID=A0ACB9L365_9MYRT|nr:hypothetical protein MLD38_039776 [Melastoma candidum]
MTKKVVLKVGFHGEKGRKHVLKAVSKVEGVDEVAVDVEKGTLTVIGKVDAVCIVNRLRKCGHTVEIDSVGPPPKPPEKPAPPPKEEKKPPPPPPCCRPCPPPCPPYPSPCYEYETAPCSIM